MNVWANKERSWRKSRKRGVSPIIATILLVAITVVLAAVLYVLISGLTKGPGNTPLGSAFGSGAANLVTGSASTNAIGCKTGDNCYSLTIEQASTGLTLSSIGFEVRNASGTATTGVVSIAIVSIQSAAAATTVPALCASAVCNGGSGTTGWTYGTTGPCVNSACGSGTQISSATMYILVDMGTQRVTGTGLTLLALAQGSYSGTVPINLP